MGLKKRKTGMLILLLGLPVFLFVWGKLSLTHHFDLQIYTSGDLDENGDTIYHKTLAFELKNYKGEKVLNTDMEGSYYIAAFYTVNCRNNCMKMISQVAKVEESFSDKEDFKIILFTTDSSNLVKEVLRDYAFTDKVTVLMGDEKNLIELAHKSYFVKGKDESRDDFENKFVLIDKNGHIRGFYLGTDNAQIDRMLTEIRLLSTKYEKG